MKIPGRHSLTKRGRYFILLMVILLLSVCNNDDQPINNAIRVLCVNIHAGKTVDGESNLDALAELIN